MHSTVVSKTNGAKRSVPAITPEEALEILASAINYCRQAGMLVQAGNVNGKLALTIDGAYIDRAGKEARFVAGTPPPEVLVQPPGDVLVHESETEEEHSQCTAL